MIDLFNNDVWLRLSRVEEKQSEAIEIRRYVPNTTNWKEVRNGQATSHFNESKHKETCRRKKSKRKKKRK